MGKNQSASNLTNIIKQDASGNITFVSGSTTLMSVSSSGAITTTGNVAGTASYASNAELLDGLDSTVFTLTSSFAAQTASFTAFTASVNTFTASQNITNGTFTLTSSFAAQTASFTAFTASQNILNGKYATTGSNTFTGVQTINSNLTVTGSITAQTLVVQTITSSVDFVTGSTRFGSILANTHIFSGSITMNPGGLFVSSSGNVGIGTTTPRISATGTNRTLDIKGGIYFGDTNSESCTINNDDSMIFNIDANNSSTSNFFRFATNTTLETGGTELMRITETGSVGIGTSSPANLLDLVTTTTPLRIVNTILTNNQQAWIKLRQSTTNLYGADIGIDTTTGGDFVIGRNNNTDTFTEAFRIKRTNGNIGIDCVPSFKLQVQADDAGSYDQASGQFVISGATNSNKRLNIGYNTTNNIGFIQAGINGTGYSTLLLNPNGVNVGIGKTSLSGGILVISGDNGGTSTNTQMQVNTITSQVSISCYDPVGSAYKRFTVYSLDVRLSALGSGTVSSNADGVLSGSDGRLKNKTRPLENGLEKVLALVPTYFKWKEDSPFYTEQDYEELGFIAQEVGAVIPEASPEPETNKVKNFHDRAIIAALVKAIQELKAENDTLKEILQRNNIQ